MRVLMVSFAFYPGRGGLERQSWQLAQRLTRRGCRVTAVTVARPGLAAFQVADGITIYRVGTARGRHSENAASVSSYLNILIFCLALFIFLLFQARRFDVIHVNQALFTAFVGLVAGKFWRKPVVVRISGTGITGDVAHLQRRWFNRAARVVIRRADAFVALTSEGQRELAGAGFDEARTCLIPNGVDLEKFRPTPRPRHRDHLVTVFFPGRFTVEKGHQLLVSAWKDVTEPGARLVLAGDGPLRAAVMSFASALGCAGRIEFAGEVENVVDYWASADIFVLPSSGEGMSNALLEAMACGLPCVVSDLAANLELIQDGVNGLVFRSGDARDLARVLNRLIRDEDLARELGRTARQMAELRFDFDAITARYIALYINVMRGVTCLG